MKKILKYEYAIFDIECDYENISEATNFLLNEFKGLDKMLSEYDSAMKYWKMILRMQGIKSTKLDIENAYTLAYGYGLEYEWE